MFSEEEIRRILSEVQVDPRFCVQGKTQYEEAESSAKSVGIMLIVIIVVLLGVFVAVVVNIAGGF